MNNEETTTPAPTALERLTELKGKFENFISTDKLNELRSNLTDTLEHAQKSVSKKVDQEVKQSLKQTSKFIDSHKKELESFQKKINSLLAKFGGGKKKKSAKKASSKKAAPKKSAKKATAKKPAAKKKR